MPLHSINDILAHLPVSRTAFEAQVKRVAAEVTHEATKLSPALGEVSIDELKEAIIRLFAERMRQ